VGDVTVPLLKAVIRCRDVDASRKFYAGVLGFEVIDEWDQAEGKGIVVALDGGGCIEAAQTPRDAVGYDESFDNPVSNDKIELQVRVDSIDHWADALQGVWTFEGPVDRPWGHRYLWLRDPDRVRVALYEKTV
jgi:catechol 2,3-dioxygenase-like lactoylglutathione lyase family enzyme